MYDNKEGGSIYRNGNGLMKKITAWGASALVVLIIGTVYTRMIPAMVREEAKIAVHDSVGENKESLKILRQIVEENIRDDKETHPKVDALIKEIDNLRQEVRDLRKELASRDAATNKKLDDLIKLTIELAKSK